VALCNSHTPMAMIRNPHWSATGSRIMFNSSVRHQIRADWSNNATVQHEPTQDVRQQTRFHTVSTFGSFSSRYEADRLSEVIDGPAFSGTSARLAAFRVFVGMRMVDEVNL